VPYYGKKLGRVPDKCLLGCCRFPNPVI